MNEYQNFVSNLKLPTSTSDAKSVYAFSLHKSGSTMLFNMLSEIAKYDGRKYYSLPDIAFAEGVHPRAELFGVERIFKDTGYLYGGFRHLPDTYQIPELELHKKIVLVRNPLDVLVSLYFSESKSHIVPKRGKLKDMLMKKREISLQTNINDYVIKQAEGQLKRTLTYTQVFAHSNCALYRYEDIIYNKTEFLFEICKFLGMNVSDEVITKVAKSYDVFPERESESEHIRQVHPGNYKKHLTEETQSILKEKFKTVLEAFGYLPSTKIAHNHLLG